MTMSYYQESFAMQKKDDNHLVPGPDYTMDASKHPYQAPGVSGGPL